MRQAFIITYDVRDPKRLRRVYRIMRGYGRHLQLSVFQCELNAQERIELLAKLRSTIHHGEDQVLFVDIGPADGRGATSIESVGTPYVPEERRARDCMTGGRGAARTLKRCEGHSGEQTAGPARNAAIVL